MPENPSDDPAPLRALSESDRHETPNAPPPIDDEDGRQPLRVDRLRVVDPTLSEEQAVALLEESDRIQLALDEQGVTDRDLFLRHEIESAEVSEDELRAYYEAHLDRFGDRTFEQSRSSVETLVRLREVRSRYGALP